MRCKYFMGVLVLFLVFLWIRNIHPVMAGDKEDCDELYRYVQWGEIDSVKDMLKKNPGCVNYNNGEVLQMAVGLVKDPQIIKMLLDTGANPNVKQTNTDNNPLHIVLEECTPDNAKDVLAIVKLLVAKGCDVNHKRSGDGYTPLHIAARKESVNKDIFSALLNAKNLNPNIRCNQINEHQDGAWIPLFYVVQRSNDPDNCNLEIVKMLIAKGSDLKSLSTDQPPATKLNWNVLHFLCDTTTDRDDIAKVLVEAGLPVDTPSKKFNMTPLHIALMSNNPKICQFLLEKGADINSANSDGVTVIRHAHGFCTDKHFESAKVVIKWAETHK